MPTQDWGVLAESVVPGIEGPGLSGQVVTKAFERMGVEKVAVLLTGVVALLRGTGEVWHEAQDEVAEERKPPGPEVHLVVQMRAVGKEDGSFHPEEGGMGDRLEGSWGSLEEADYIGGSVTRSQRQHCVLTHIGGNPPIKGG